MLPEKLRPLTPVRVGSQRTSGDKDGHNTCITHNNFFIYKIGVVFCIYTFVLHYKIKHRKKGQMRPRRFLYASNGDQRTKPVKSIIPQTIRRQKIWCTYDAVFLDCCRLAEVHLWHTMPKQTGNMCRPTLIALSRCQHFLY